MNVPAASLPDATNLQQLLHGIASAPPIELADISSDSRRLVTGGLFVASKGERSHGLDFLAQAEAAGVAAVIWDPASAPQRTSAVPLVPVPDLANHIGTIANRWFDAPSEALQVTGVTGTNGKTTTAWLLRQCLQSAGLPCAYIGTLGAGLGSIEDRHGLTTPACIDMHRLLADSRDAGATQAAIEVSSHALAQGRVDGVHFDTALFTNLSRDHIDYHGSMQAYGDTKARLFLEFGAVHRIVCVDSAFGRELMTRVGPEAIAVATTETPDIGDHRFIAVQSLAAGEQGSKIVFTSSWGAGEVQLPLPGQFNVANALQVLAALLVRDIPLGDACALLGNVAAPPGRMQQVAIGADRPLPAVYVDYAHTPDSLDVALRALRRHCAGKLWCVFGCGGDRDRGKRRQMGRIAADLADVPVVTNDNPRSEPPSQIIGEILEGMPGGSLVIEDRGAAIAHAVASAAADDIILLAGKGHEDYQIIGTRVTNFSDYDVAHGCLAARAGTGA